MAPPARETKMPCIHAEPCAAGDLTCPTFCAEMIQSIYENIQKLMVGQVRISGQLLNMSRSQRSLESAMASMRMEVMESMVMDHLQTLDAGSAPLEQLDLVAARGWSASFAGPAAAAAATLPEVVPHRRNSRSSEASRQSARHGLQRVPCMMELPPVSSGSMSPLSSDCSEHILQSDANTPCLGTNWTASSEEIDTAVAELLVADVPAPPAVADPQPPVAATKCKAEMERAVPPTSPCPPPSTMRVRSRLSEKISTALASATAAVHFERSRGAEEQPVCDCEASSTAPLAEVLPKLSGPSSTRGRGACSSGRLHTKSSGSSAAAD